jgi:2-phosphosulfolactate phosphatase
LEIVDSYGIDAAPTARGHVIVIDVLRAFTTAAYALGRGAERVVLVGKPDEAFAVRDRLGCGLLVGEDGGRMVAGYDCGNSPEQIDTLDLTGRTVILRSSSGTQGVVHAGAAERIYLGSLVVAASTVRAIQAERAAMVTILAMGARHGPDREEDLACQAYMRALFENRPVDRVSVIRAVVESPAGQVALDPNIAWKTPGDLDRAVAIDRFDFAMPVTREDGLLVARPLPAARINR